MLRYFQLGSGSGSRPWRAQVPSVGNPEVPSPWMSPGLPAFLCAKPGDISATYRVASKSGVRLNQPPMARGDQMALSGAVSTVEKSLESPDPPCAPGKSGPDYEFSPREMCQVCLESSQGRWIRRSDPTGTWAVAFNSGVPNAHSSPVSLIVSRTAASRQKRAIEGIV